jgi:hypothetical protein
MPEQDLNSNCKAAMAITPVAAVAIADGSDINTLGFESVEFIVFSGTLGTGTIDFTLQEADDDGAGAPDTYSDVAAGDILGTPPTILATEDDKVWRFGYIGKKQWVRLQNVETSAWTSMIHGAVCVLSNPVLKPVAAQIT